ncbi:DUF418 domain-containing protein [Streptomyces xiamenensis]|uniref:DUF418 domain-containing protein n=1 Tax=Streptomyces xiamenensis TaxID=408015 RepID=UPI0035D8429E
MTIVVSPPHAKTADPPSAPSGARLVGVDLARGLAVFGMYAAHVGPDPADGGVGGVLLELTHGRSSALFALLAGFSLVLIMGRTAPRTGRDGRQAAVRVLVRAVILLAAGTALTMTGTPVAVILACYGLYFVLALPLYRLGVRALAGIAAAGALLMPQVLFPLQESAREGAWAEQVTALDPLAAISGTDGFLGLLVTGVYPAPTWLPFVVTGMAVARLDLGSARIRGRLAALGAVLAALGYGCSWLALRLPGVMERLTEHAGPMERDLASLWWSDVGGYPSGGTSAWQLVASPHSDTTLSVMGNTGVALLVLALCLTLTGARATWPRRVAAPVCAVGSMSLTAYVLHIGGIGLLGIEELPGSPPGVLAWFVVLMTALAMAWKRFFRRGPLEQLLHSATGVARRVR